MNASISEQQRLKVVFLTSSYPRSRDDTASVFLRYLAEHLADSGFEIHVLAPADGKGETRLEGKVTVHRFQYFAPRLQRLTYGSGIVSNLRRSPWLWLQVPVFVLAMTYSLFRTIRREQIELIHAHWVLPQGLVGVAAKFLSRLPLITTLHGADAFAFRGKLAGVLKRFVIGRSDAWTANTPPTAQVIDADASALRPHVIPMGVDTELFAGGNPASLRQQLPPGEFMLLFVGRLVEKKGCRDLLKALSLLPPSLRHRTMLWIIGDGDQRNSLEQLAKDLGIAPKVKFWGFIINQQLADFYAAADLFIAPSVEAESGDTEGQGVVILEAFAGNACVLTTRVGGIEAVVHDNVSGVLVSPNRPQDLAQAMERLLSDPELRKRLADNAFNEARDYDWKRIAGEFANLYREVANRRVQQASLDPE